MHTASERDDWDYYLCRLDEDRASITLDLGLAARAPLSTHPHAMVVAVPMLGPRDDGMSSDAEYDALIALEDDLVAVLRAEGATYVGRLTARGSRIFYFYAVDPDAAARTARAALAAHTDYRPQISSHADPDWSLYSGFLLPSPEIIGASRHAG